MSKSTLTLIVLLTFLAGLTGYNYFVKPFGDDNRVEVATSTNTTPPPSTR